ncbi:MAG: hypothetical protein GY856_14510 [bacterium]|nr:hypothetical protein [bacterium]
MSDPKPLIIIPVRAGSKGLVRKNLRCVGGLSLVARAVRTARRACGLLGGGRVVVDSEDEELLAEGRSWGAETPYRRPAELATDTAGTMEVLAHALRRLEISSDDSRPVVLVQATSPLLRPEHLVEAVRRWLQGDGSPVASVAPVAHPPAWQYRLDARGVLQPLVPGTAGIRRQDLPAVARLTGAVYVGSARQVLAGDHFVQPGRTRAVVMPAEQAVDIDDETDLAMAETLAAGEESAVGVGEREVGPGFPCFVVAEAGVNHDGDLAEAHRLIDAAAETGADAVKFQTWRTELLCRPGARKADYQAANVGTGGDQYEMLKRLELPYEAHPELKAHAEERNLLFLSTPDEIVSARFLAGLGVPALKIGSAELDNLPFLAEIAALGLPVLLSTGMGTLVEVSRALETLAAHGNPPVVLLHAVSSYPAPPEAMNVRAIRTMRRAFGLPVGLSDHCPGPEAVLAAVGLGLPIWEKHLTRDRSRLGPDHRASLETAAFAEQVRLLRAAERALGDGVKRPQACESSTREVVRKRLHAARDLPAGHPLEADDLLALRAAEGMPVGQWERLIGRRLRQPLAALTPLAEEQLDG